MSFVSDPKKPVGGHILAHASQTRVMVSHTYGSYYDSVIFSTF